MRLETTYTIYTWLFLDSTYIHIFADLVNILPLTDNWDASMCEYTKTENEESYPLYCCEEA